MTRNEAPDQPAAARMLRWSSRKAPRRLADALVFQDLAVLEPAAGWLYRYEERVPWRSIALGCEYHDGRGWMKKTDDKPPRGALAGYLIRY